MSMYVMTHRLISPVEPYDFASIRRLFQPSERIDEARLHQAARVAAAQIERLAGVALLNQNVLVTIFDPPVDPGFALPIGPAPLDHEPSVTVDDVPYIDFHFLGGSRPHIRWKDGLFEDPPDRISIGYRAGFGDALTDIPWDLKEAVLYRTIQLYRERLTNQLAAVVPT